MASADRTLLIDFGSTFTKVVAVETDPPRLIGRAAAPTTVRDDIMIGLQEALVKLARDFGIDVASCGQRIAASSAAGGLKMVAIGLVPELTVEAARRAALGAGAKLQCGLAYELTSEDLKRIEALAPDVVLLAGGTDGGNKDVIIRNAEHLAGCSLKAPVVVAGNRNAAGRVREILIAAGKEARVTENVLPRLGTLSVEPVREVIRSIFMERIVHAKGLDKAREFVSDVVMPTPAAVLRAADLLSRGVAGEDGLGDLMVVDIGGATTDVHSLAAGEPTKAGVMLRGLPEPFAKRTVEGDLGVRVSAQSLWEAAGESKLARALQRVGLDPAEIDGLNIERSLTGLPGHPEVLPDSEAMAKLDAAMALVCCETAVERHVGQLETHYTPFGATYIQRGKDLTATTTIIGTGGPLVHSPHPEAILAGCLFDAGQPHLLKPVNPRVLVDREYLLSAMGLLAERNAQAALILMKRHILGGEILCS